MAVSVMQSVSYCTESKLSNGSASIFSNRELAKQLMIGRTKFRYIINSSIAPYFKQLLIDKKMFSLYIIYSDERLNKVTQDCQM